MKPGYKNISALKIDCPVCPAKAGMTCKIPLGVAHKERWRKAPSPVIAKSFLEPKSRPKGGKQYVPKVRPKEWKSANCSGIPGKFHSACCSLRCTCECHLTN